METKPRQSWFRRNWQWFLPVSVFGCVLLLIAFTGLIQALSFIFIKRSDLYRHSIFIVRDSGQVAEVFGPPIEAGVRVSRKIDQLESGDRIELSFPIEGTKKTGVVHVVALQQADRTPFQVFEVRVNEDDVTLDLLRSGFFNQP